MLRRVLWAYGDAEGFRFARVSLGDSVWGSGLFMCFHVIQALLVLFTV